MAFAGLFVALVFKTLLDTSRAAPKSYPRRCRWISVPFFDLVRLVFCAFHSPVSPEDSYFSLYLAHVFKQLSSGLSLDFLLYVWTWLDLCLRLRAPANAEESKVCLYFGHVFQELFSMLSLDFLPSFWTWFDLFWRLRPPPPPCQRRG